MSDENDANESVHTEPSIEQADVDDNTTQNDESDKPTADDCNSNIDNEQDTAASTTEDIDNNNSNTTTPNDTTTAHDEVSPQNTQAQISNDEINETNNDNTTNLSPEINAVSEKQDESQPEVETEVEVVTEAEPETKEETSEVKQDEMESQIEENEISTMESPEISAQSQDDVNNDKTNSSQTEEATPETTEAQQDTASASAVTTQEINEAVAETQESLNEDVKMDTNEADTAVEMNESTNDDSNTMVQSNVTVDVNDAMQFVRQIAEYVDPATPINQDTLDKAWQHVTQSNSQITANNVQSICGHASAEWTQEVNKQNDVNAPPIQRQDTDVVATEKETNESHNELSANVANDVIKNIQLTQQNESIPSEEQSSTNLINSNEEPTASNDDRSNTDAADADNDNNDDGELDIPKSELDHIWSMFDKDNNGYITLDQFTDVLRVCGRHVSNKEAKMMIKKVDSDENHKITYDELIMFLKSRPRESEERIVKAFKRFDINGDGKIDIHELRITLTTMGEKLTTEEVDSVLGEMDIDGDGCVDFNEFTQAMLK